MFKRGLQERLADKEARALARSERNRLKAQDAAKKRQLDKLRLEQNSSVDDGEVWWAPLEILACLLACWGLQRYTLCSLKEFMMCLECLKWLWWTI